MRHQRLALAYAILAALGCGRAAPYDWKLPPGFPEPFVPSDNPMSEAKVSLGRRLFYDRRLSANQTMACATCHVQSRAFSDGVSTPSGSTGDQLARNSMSLTNVAYNSTYTWPNPILDTLEKQARIPMFADHPVELGITSHEDEVLARFRETDAPRFASAFPEDAEPVSFDNIVRAIASFQRTLLSGNSPYDRFTYQKDTAALSDEAKQGMALFFSERLECYHCHGGINFSSAFRTATSTTTEKVFQNNGLYNLGGTGAYPGNNRGLVDFTANPIDMGKFRVPTLRNIALTAPYMHDGSIPTLEAVLDHYAAGGRVIESGDHAGDGRANRYKNPLVRGFTLTAEERAAVLAFLHALTDDTFVSNPGFSSPFP